VSQDEILAVLSDVPVTQKQLMQQLHIESGVLSHRLNSLLRKGLIERHVLEIPYRPFGYVLAARYEALSFGRKYTRSRLGFPCQ